jgi:hypothetical protein
LEQAVRTTFGDYVTTINAISCRPAGDDASKANGWMITARVDDRRIAFWNETASGNKGVQKLDGSTLKNFCSGGDIIKARKLHQNDVEIINNTIVFANMNKVPEVEPADALKTACVFNLPLSFDEPDPSLSCTRQGYDVKSWIKSTAWFPMAYAWCVFNKFSDTPTPQSQMPEECRIIKDIVIGNQVTDEIGLFRKFLKTDSTGMAPKPDVNKLFKQHLNKTPQATRKWLDSQGYKTHRTANGEFYTGLILITIEDEE